MIRIALSTLCILAPIVALALQASAAIDNPANQITTSPRATPLLVTKKTLPQKPNIVFIFIDDMGYGDIAPFGSTLNLTPQLDRMAAEGLKLTQFYVSASACTPSRSSLMTGCHADRVSMDGRVVFPGDPRGLNPAEITIAEILKTKGYATGCFGKWHLGDQPQFMPLAQGFDQYVGIPYSNDMYAVRKKHPPLPFIINNKAVAHIPDGPSQALLTKATTDAAVQFIKDHRDEPFFLYLPFAAIHFPRYVEPHLLAAANDDVTRAQIQEVDHATGRILDTLRKLKLDQKTLVIFTSDNGGSGGTSMGPLRGAKGGPKFEGHMRVPTIAWWPSRIPAGTITHEIAATIDIFPTCAALAGAPMPVDRIIDGHDISNILLQKPGAKSPHELLYYEYMAIRRGPWKLLRHESKAHEYEYNKVELYNLDQDLGEQNNLIQQHPHIAKELGGLLDQHIASVQANRRPNGQFQNPKPILNTPPNVPTLVDYLKSTNN